MTCECNQRSAERFGRWRAFSGTGELPACRNPGMPLRGYGVQWSAHDLAAWGGPWPLHRLVDSIAFQLSWWLPQPAPFALPGNARREPEELAACRIAADVVAEGVALDKAAGETLWSVEGDTAENERRARELNGQAADAFERAREILGQIVLQRPTRRTFSSFNLLSLARMLPANRGWCLDVLRAANTPRWARIEYSRRPRTGPARIPAENATMQFDGGK